jgi:hypothetical protein
MREEEEDDDDDANTSRERGYLGKKGAGAKERQVDKTKVIRFTGNN